MKINSVEEKSDLVSYYIQYKQNEKSTCINGRIYVLKMSEFAKF